MTKRSQFAGLTLIKSTVGRNLVLLPANRTNIDKTKAEMAHANGRNAVARISTDLFDDLSEQQEKPR